MSRDMLGEALRGVCGPLSDFSQKLAGPDGEAWLEAFKRFLRKENPWSAGAIVSTLIRDMTKEGWKLLANTDRRINSVDGLELISFLKSGESCVDGEEMVRRARQELNANLGQEDAEWLLEHQDQIPAEFRNYCLTFPGTVWQDSSGRRFVPGLGWYGGRWYLHFDWLEYDWGSGGRLLRSRK